MRNSTIKLITAVSACVVLGIIALVMKLTNPSSPGQPSTSPDGSTQVPAPQPATSQPARPQLKSVCTPDKPIGINDAAYSLTLTNTGSQTETVQSVAVAFYQGGTEDGSGDDPVVGFKPVTIAPGQSATERLVTFLVSSQRAGRSWTCTLTGFSQ